MGDGVVMEDGGGRKLDRDDEGGERLGDTLVQRWLAVMAESGLTRTNTKGKASTGRSRCCKEVGQQRGVLYQGITYRYRDPWRRQWDGGCMSVPVTLSSVFLCCLCFLCLLRV
jgi:hypothetical protein